MSTTAVEDVTVIEPAGTLSLPKMRDLWAYRDLLFFLAWRDVALKYKQTVLGAAWAIVQPLLSTLVFTIIFGRIAKLQSDGVPYALFVFSGLLLWQFFSAVLQRVSGSLVANAGLLSKVYFPRLIIPLSTSMPSFLDFAVSFVALVGMMFYFRWMPGWTMLFVPVVLLLAFLVAMGLGLCLAAVNVRHRDVTYVMPFTMQVWLFASPILYAASLIPAQWRPLYDLNPLTGLMDGFRWAVLGVGTFPASGLVAVALEGALLLWIGVVYFSRTEETFADVV